ncbi:MAG: TMEM175 family protein [Ferruginibacter sp.]
MATKTFILSTTRLENFSDGVFAIILTLLAFQFKIPKFTNDIGLVYNFSELLAIAPYLLGFVFSFFFIAVFWVNHHSLYHAVTEVNIVLIWYNIHSLFWISMIPFTIAMVGNHPNLSIAAISLGIVLFMASLAAFLLFRYCYIKSKLVDETLSLQTIDKGNLRNIAAIAVTFLGILIAFKWVYLSYCVYFVVIIIFVIPLKMEKKMRSSKDRTQQEPTTIIW